MRRPKFTAVTARNKTHCRCAALGIERKGEKDGRRTVDFVAEYPRAAA